MRRRFFVDRFERDSAVLHDEAAEHLGRVLRAEPGQLYELSDGEHVWLARVERVAVSKRGPNQIDFALVEPIDVAQPSLRVSLFISIVKFDRFEWCLEKATELGADEITPLAAVRTDKPLLAAAARRHDRWQRILLESAQQSRRLRQPELKAATKPADAFTRSSEALKIFLSERRDAEALRYVLRSRGNATAPQQSVALAIGPEGGWTDEEIAAGCANCFFEASLGKNILRTETAVIAALAILQFALQKD